LHYFKYGSNVPKVPFYITLIYTKEKYWKIFLKTKGAYYRRLSSMRLSASASPRPSSRHSSRMAAMGRRFRGLLYGGLMLTPDRGPMVSVNCRFGDPETQAVLRAWRMTFCLGSWPRPRRVARRLADLVDRISVWWCWQPRAIRQGAQRRPIDELARRTACRRRHRSGRVSRRHKREESACSPWRPRTGRDRAGRRIQFSASARLQCIDVFGGMHALSKRLGLRGRT